MKNNTAPKFKTGDRLWFWLDEPKSDFEDIVSNQLENFDSKSDFFHVQVFSWKRAQTSSLESIFSHIPKQFEASKDRSIGFYRIDHELKLNIPMVRLMYSDRAAGGNIRVSPLEFEFYDQTLIVIASRFDDHEIGHISLKGSLDSIGFLSLIFGMNIFQTPLLSSYFDNKKKKFVSGELIVRNETEHEKNVFGIKSFYQLDKFLGDNNIIHASMWFAGQAFTQESRAGKIISYHTAFEIIGGGVRYRNHFKKLYKGMENADQAEETLKNLAKLRHDLVHCGIVGNFTRDLERYAQLLLLDAIVEKQTGELPKSAFLTAFDASQPFDD